MKLYKYAVINKTVPYYSEVSNFNGTESLIHLLADTREEAVANAACVLTNMATEEQLRGEAQGKGTITALIEPSKSRSLYNCFHNVYIL